MRDSKVCHHELLQRVDRMEKAPPMTNGVMKPFMVCSECGAILYLAMTLRGEPEVHKPWAGSEG